MKNVVIGIHGLGNKPPEHILSTWWFQSIHEGAKRWGLDIKDLDFELVYWADILHPIPQDPEVSDYESPLFLEDPYVPSMREIRPSTRNLKRRIADFLEEKISKILLNEDFSINYQSVTDSLIRRYFKDLDAYYTSELSPDNSTTTRDEIRNRLITVLQKHQGERILLIAHSMGSIIAFDVLDMNQNLQVDTLVTIGSPLGFPVVIGRMGSERSDKHTAGKVLQIPDNIKKSWYNLADLEDNVAFDFRLSDDYSGNSFGVKPIDMPVANDYEYRRNRNPHKVYGYLRTKELVELVSVFVRTRKKSWLQKTTRNLRNFFTGRKTPDITTSPSSSMNGQLATFKSPHFLPAPIPESASILNRNNAITHLKNNTDSWDFIVVGGGATGMGVAVEAASRGYKTLLLEQYDFGKGTSSRSTKLVHGGVRYLQQGNISLVLEALRERAILRKNAPHLVHDQPFVVPHYDWWEGPFYGIGLRLYDMLAGRHGFGPSINLSPEETQIRIPQIETKGLKGGVQYHDGQFDDARLVINLAQTAADEGATVINYMEVEHLIQNNGFVEGVVVRDTLSNEEFEINARCVINATGVFTDNIRRLDDPASTPIIKASRGVHIVLDRSFLGGDTAIMVPHTDDGRVLFAIPWLGKVVIGTTDTEVESLDIEPVAQPEEISFIISNAARYLTKDPEPADIKSVFAGLRPLVMQKSAENTAELSREHQILISSSGLVTITGGKWTTYRLMAEETIDQAAAIAQLDYVPSQTKNLAIHGWDQNFPVFGVLGHYGVDAYKIEAMIDETPKLGKYLHERLPITGAMVVWAAREEMAQTIEDVLARRTRCLLLDARASSEIAEDVAKILADELGKNKAWIKSQVKEYQELVTNYLPTEH
ncbi:MAG: glycerol-3-phosphate dehydrogenase/oxidase [Candidatus Electryonea clarkiae]|nr:glycerol-3-phosphate dehydrogenase/oxidase [Candidatus Electryonea clarkiae]MDP8286768.1 glycerol-3-phosphate dehydrogenase/oxidase [Candidatus Electryonea clarkiae]